VTVAMLVLLLAVKVDWVPPGGFDGMFSRSMIIPTIALGLPGIAGVARLARATTLGTLYEDFVRRERRTGLGERVVGRGNSAREHRSTDQVGTGQDDVTADLQYVAAEKEFEAGMIRGESLTRRATRKLLHKKIAIVCLTLIAIFYAAGILAPLVAPYGYAEQNLDLSFHSPTLSHPFGTDRNGRDVLSRTIFAARTTVIVTAATLLTGFILLPVSLGLLAGYRGGFIDAL